LRPVRSHRRRAGRLGVSLPSSLSHACRHVPDRDGRAGGWATRRTAGGRERMKYMIALMLAGTATPAIAQDHGHDHSMPMPTAGPQGADEAAEEESSGEDASPPT